MNDKNKDILGALAVHMGGYTIYLDLLVRLGVRRPKVLF